MVADAGYVYQSLRKTNTLQRPLIGQLCFVQQRREARIGVQTPKRRINPQIFQGTLGVLIGLVKPPERGVRLAAISVSRSDEIRIAIRKAAFEFIQSGIRIGASTHRPVDGGESCE